MERVPKRSRLPRSMAAFVFRSDKLVEAHPLWTDLTALSWRWRRAKRPDTIGSERSEDCRFAFYSSGSATEFAQIDRSTATPPAALTPSRATVTVRPPLGTRADSPPCVERDLPAVLLLRPLSQHIH